VTCGPLVWGNLLGRIWVFLLWDEAFLGSGVLVLSLPNLSCTSPFLGTKHSCSGLGFSSPSQGLSLLEVLVCEEVGQIDFQAFCLLLECQLFSNPKSDPSQLSEIWDVQLPELIFQV
jgi:hypothetical protein